jgi:hypothetical protein
MGGALAADDNWRHAPSLYLNFCACAYQGTCKYGSAECITIQPRKQHRTPSARVKTARDLGLCHSFQEMVMVIIMIKNWNDAADDNDDDNNNNNNKWVLMH